MDEFNLIERYFARRATRRDVRLGIGDDAAVVAAPPGGDLVVTTDVLVSGIHFPEDTPAVSVGHKALAVNLSDVAAMGAAPAWASLALTLPEADEAWLEGFCEGFFALAQAFDVALIGGDTTHGPLSISVTAIGVVGSAGYLSRGGAREGDAIYVSGTLGDAALGLRADADMLTASAQDRAYFRERLETPTPRLALGRALAGLASAAIDVSDGLASDLGHICRRSGVGAVVDVARVPVSEAYRRCLASVGYEPALGFGDDYELCFTVPPEREDAVEGLSRELGLALTPVGRVAGERLEWVCNGEPYVIHGQGYRHFG